MNILIAPNAFKGSLTSFEIAEIIASAVQEVFPLAHCLQFPVADGGDGTAEVLFRQLGGKRIMQKVQNPIGLSIAAPIYITPDHTAIIELADASGLKLLKTTEYDALGASTYGTGQLLKVALDQGCQRIVLGVGGSATNDAGTGVLRALGVRFLDQEEKETQELTEIAHIDKSLLDERLKNCEIIVPCDVENPFVGSKGSAIVFGPQKGATTELVEELHRAHERFADLIENQCEISIHNMPFGGAAGGVAAGLHGILGAKLVKGSAFILDELDFNHALHDANLVITGEGHIDEQSTSGKAPFEVAMRAKKLNKPIIAIGGGVSLALNSTSYDVALSICNKPMDLAFAMSHAKELLHAQTIQAMRLIKVGIGI